MPHLMLDLETLSIKPIAPVCQMAACMFELQTGLVLDKPYNLLQMHTVPEGTIEWETVQWWLEQDEEPRKVMATKEHRLKMKDALNNLAQYITSNEVEGVWSHGATFDIVILEYWFRVHQIKTPWSHKQIRDTRTMLWLAPHVEVKAVVKHDALQDVIAQARAIQQAYAFITGDRR